MLILLLRRFMLTLLRVYELLFIARAILSWFPMMSMGGISDFLYTMTEPIVAPIRNVLWKIPFLQGLPIDLSFLVVFLLIEVLYNIFL